MYKYPIIVFEGIEGSGKSLHIKNVSRFLKKKKRKFIKIREPGGSKSAEKIRKLLLNNKSNFNSITDLLLYFASISENIEKIININKGKKIILIDRFIDSTLAYQHYGMGLNLRFIQTINNFITKNIKSNFTFLNLVNKKNLQKRLSKRKNLNRYDKFKIDFYEKVQKGFIKIANKNSNRYLKVNSNLEMSFNKKVIIKKLEKLI